MSSSHFGVHSSYPRGLSATDAHVLLSLTLLQLYLWYLQTHSICVHKAGQSRPVTENIQCFTHTSRRSLLRGLGSQPALSMSVTHHTAAYTADTCHSEVVLSHFCELGQSLQSLSQECCLSEGICVNRKFMYGEVLFPYQAFIIK